MSSFRNSSRWAIACCIIVGLATVNVNAAVLIQELFDYPDGQLTDSEVGGNPGDNVSGGLWTAHGGETFEDNVDVIGGQAQVLNSGSEDVNRLVGPTMMAGDKWYYGAHVTVNYTGMPDDGLNNDYFIHFKDDTFGFRTRVYVDDPNTASNDYTFGLAASSGGQVAKWADDLAFGTQHTIMASYEFDTGESKLWVDPVDENSTSITDTNGEMTEIIALALRQDFISPGTPNNEILVDSVAAGDNFGEVMAALVPEPSSLMLLAMALLLIGTRRRS